MTKLSPIPTEQARIIHGGVLSTAHNARDLIPNGTETKIVLDEQVYTLRITKAGKLILNK